LAAASKTFRTQTDWLSEVFDMALVRSLYSSGENRAFTMMSRNLPLGTLGLPSFGFIKYFTFYENSSLQKILFVLHLSNIKD
jgi:hypothetical protein